MRLHRAPEYLRQLEEICEQLKVSVPMALDAQAATLLVPELAPRLRSGDLNLDDVRPEVWRAYWRLLTEAAEGGDDA